MAHFSHQSKLASIVLGLFGFAAVSAPATPVTFSDTFSPPSPLWNNHTGNWTATSGQYFAQQASNSPLAVTELPYNLTDLTLTVNVTNLTDGGIVLHGNAANTNSVLLVLGGNGYGQGERGGRAGTSIYWSLNGGASQSEVDGVFTPGGNYTITATVVGNVYSAYINGSSTPATTFTTSLDSSGMAGLYDDQPNTPAHGFGSPMTFSSFSLSGTAIPEPSSVGLLAAAALGSLLRRRRIREN